MTWACKLVLGGIFVSSFLALLVGCAAPLPRETAHDIDGITVLTGIGRSDTLKALFKAVVPKQVAIKPAE